MEKVTAGVYLVSISRSRYSAVCGGGHAKTALLHAVISADAQAWLEKDISNFSPYTTNIRKYCPSNNKIKRLYKFKKIPVQTGFDW
jgi:hypothetical protein